MDDPALDETRGSHDAHLADAAGETAENGRSFAQQEVRVRRAEMAEADTTLRTGSVHVWRVPLDTAGDAELVTLLSEDERDRARRFHFERHRREFVIAHGMLRRILRRYTDSAVETLSFEQGPNGKPFLAGQSGMGRLEFNLSHSGAIALVAVARGSAVGIDVERWDGRVEHLEIADQFFSAAECNELRGLSGSRDAVSAGFFAAWSRKEAYLKASGHGISRGLHHFDVSLMPGAPARLLADRLEHDALERWQMLSLDAGQGYSAALVAESPIHEVLLLDAFPPRVP